MLAKVQDHEALRHRAQKFSAEAKLLVVAVVDLVRQTPQSNIDRHRKNMKDNGKFKTNRLDEILHFSFLCSKATFSKSIGSHFGTNLQIININWRMFIRHF